MLGKLIKHDFRALSRTLFPLQIGILGGGLVATILSALSIRLSEASWMGANGSNLMKMLLLGASVTVAVLIGVAIMASMFVTLILICYHFYRSFLADEGYLTFTLPVSTSKLLWSKLLTGMFWVLINSVVVCIALADLRGVWHDDQYVAQQRRSAGLPAVLYGNSAAGKSVCQHPGDVD